MSAKATRDEKPSTSSSIVGCCQSSSTTPENSIVDYIEEDLEAPNNNTLFHATENVNGDKIAASAVTDASVIDIIAKKKASIDFTFPKRPKVDIEFQNVKYIVKKFSFQNRQFGKWNWYCLSLHRIKTRFWLSHLYTFQLWLFKKQTNWVIFFCWNRARCDNTREYLTPMLIARCRIPIITTRPSAHASHSFVSFNFVYRGVRTRVIFCINFFRFNYRTD